MKLRIEVDVPEGSALEEVTALTAALVRYVNAVSYLGLIPAGPIPLLHGERQVGRAWIEQPARVEGGA